MQMYLAGEWVSKPKTVPVTNPFQGDILDTVPVASPEDVAVTVSRLVDGAKAMRALSAWDRAQLLNRAADLMEERSEDFARTISAEEGKILAEGRLETSRSIETLRVSAEEAKRVVGEMVPLDAAPSAAGKFGFTIRIPCGVVAAITPFNFPLNLVCHKVGPALAAGNAILIKPASDTPLSALKLTQVLLEAGFPAHAVACLTGSGSELGAAICSDARIRKITFTGSAEVGQKLSQLAGLKRITLELGGNAPVIVMQDADLELAAKAIAASGFGNAGQTCISTQRVLVMEQVAADFLDALQPRVAALKAGDQFDESHQLGPLVREADAIRVESWLKDAIQQGAQAVVHGHRDGAVLSPYLLDQVDARQKISCDELFGPAVAVTRVTSLDEALQIANNTPYGLSAGIFTQDLSNTMRFMRDMEAGNLHVNWASQWRADLMPYGGLKHSGYGKEGPKYAIQEMTEEKMIVIH